MVAGNLTREIWRRANTVLVGGVNSPVRAFGAVSGDPVIVSHAKGPWVVDVDGNRYVDLLCCWGAVILGHAHPAVVEAVCSAAKNGNGYGLTAEPECRLAEMLCEACPSLERVRLVSSGTEAVMSAIRLARGVTGRNKVLMFAGGYHGHSDGLLVRAGSGLASFGLPASAGVPDTIAGETLIAPYNDLEAAQQIALEWQHDLACVIVEPVAANMGVIPPCPGFLDGLRQICTQTEALLIFDEVITGFRVAYGGAQQLYGVQPDLTTFGKIIGGGLPIGAFGGRDKIMAHLAPEGSVYQAGTLAGNPVVACAGVAVLEQLREISPYQNLETSAAQLCERIIAAAQQAGVPLHINRVASLFSLFFTDQPVKNQSSAHHTNSHQFACFHRALMAQGVLLPPSPFESCFLGVSHTQPALLDQIAQSAQYAFEVLSASKLGVG